MPAQIIDGKKIAALVSQDVQQAVLAFKARSGRVPGLAVVLVGEDPASQTYVRNKRKRCQELGILSLAHDLPAGTTETELLQLLANLNADPKVDGILVQMPLPPHLPSQKIIEAIDPAKDVDGLHPYNLGRLFSGNIQFAPCTPLGIMALIHSTGQPISGQRAVVVGRSNLVGKPTAILLLQEHATVTLCHSRTQDLEGICQQADILVVAVGKTACVPGRFVKPGSVVIDVGTNREADGLRGDVEFAAAQARAGYITPVPGGVGPMTIAMLMRNTIQAAQIREGIKP